MKKKCCQLRGTMRNTLFMDIFDSDILCVDAPHILSIEQCILKDIKGPVLKPELMKQSSSLWSGNKMLMDL